MEKFVDCIKGFKYQKWCIKMMMFDFDFKFKKKKGVEYFVFDEDIIQEWFLEYQKFFVEEQRIKIQKKFEKDNEKCVVDGEVELDEKEFKECFRVVVEFEVKYKKENKIKKVEVEGKGFVVEKFEVVVSKFDDCIKMFEL